MVCVVKVQNNVPSLRYWFLRIYNKYCWTVRISSKENLWKETPSTPIFYRKKLDENTSFVKNGWLWILITNSINVLTHMHTDKNIFNEKCKKLQHLEHTFKCLMLISSVVPTKCWSSKIMHFTSSFSSTWRYNLNSVDREIPIFFFKKHAENLSFFYATYN